MYIKRSASQRVLASLLALLMLLTMGQTGLICAFAAESGGFSVTVTDAESEEPIPGATLTVVSATAVSDETADPLQVEVLEKDAEFTDDDNDGKIEIAAITDYLTDNPEATISFSFTVQADNYEDSDEQSIEISTENVDDGITVELTDYPTVSVEVSGYSGDDSVISAYLLEDSEDEDGTELNINGSDTVYVPSGSYVKFSVPYHENYTKEINALNGDEEAQYVSSGSNDYVYCITADFVLNVTYTPITVNITVSYDSTKGEITVNDDKVVSGGTVSVDKTETETIFTVTPEEHYVLSEITLNDEEQDLPEINENNQYIFKLDNSKIEANETDYILNFEFKLTEYQITYSVDGNGEIEATVENNTKIEALSAVTFTFYPKNLDSKLIAVMVNDVYVSDLSYNNESGEYSYTISSVEEDIVVTAYFAEVDTSVFADANIYSFFTVTAEEGEVYSVSDNETNNNLLFYVSEDAKIKLELNSESIKEYAAENEITIYDNLYMDAIFRDDNNVFAGTSESYEIDFSTLEEDEVKLKSLQIVSFEGSFWSGLSKEVYLLPGSITFQIDSEGPDIENIEGVPEDYTNENQTISFEVEDGDSGVKDVTVTCTTLNKDVKCTTDEDGNYTFTAEPIDNYTDEIEYVITATDNVGNERTETITIKCDTEAPVLKDAITFSNNSDSFFRRLLNAISFGKWGEEKITITFSATDAGSGCANVYVMFVPEENDTESEDDNSCYYDCAELDSDGNGEIEIYASAFDGGTFKGRIYYKLEDSLGNIDSEWQLITSGNSNILSGNANGDDISIVMIESNAPKIALVDLIGVDGAVVNKDLDVLTASGDVEFTIKISDEDSSEDVDDNSGLYKYSVIDINTGETIMSKEYGEDTAWDTVVVSTKETEETDKLTADDNGRFAFKLTVTDNAGNVSESEFEIYQDLTSPVITGFNFKAEGNSDGINTAVIATDYGFYFKEDVTVTVNVKDIKSNKETASGVSDIDVYLVDIDDPDTQIVPDDLVISFNTEDGTATATFTIKKDFKGQIYAKATDNVGNDPTNSNLPAGYSSKDSSAENYYPYNENGYIHPDGTVVESVDKHSGNSSIIITAPQAAGTQNNSYSYSYDLNSSAVADEELSYADSTVQVPLYNSNPTFSVTVTDTYSGIRNIKWTVIEGTSSSSQSVTVPNTIESGTTEISGWSIDSTDQNIVTQMSGTIEVSGNYNDMVLVVELTDRAGNVSYDYYIFGIDKTAPSISVSYNNNNADTSSGDGNYYFNANRTATIVITERNFNSANVVVTVTRDGSTYPVSLSWKSESGSDANGDGDRHTATITYGTDGDYTFSISYTDRAQNKNNGVDYGSSVAPTAFTIDKTAPVITVSYDNNDAQNGTYFAAARTATIVIVEHNFDVNRVTFTRTATLDGSDITLPSVSWSHSGDVHTATITYSEDGDYTFDISMDDMAGNANGSVSYGSSVAANEFTVDQTINAPLIGFIDNEDDDNDDNIVYNNDNEYVENPAFNDIIRTVIKIEEEYNYASVSVSLSRVNRTESDQEEDDNNLAESLLASTGIPTGNGTFKSENFPVEIENDGIYVLTVTLTDLAGNTETSEETFTVNRFGSVFVFNDVLDEAIEATYNQSVSGSIVITEYNASPISGELFQVTCDGTQVTLPDDVVVSSDQVGSSGWYENVYTFPSSVFSSDGVYSIYISSEDGSGNVTEMSTSNAPAEASFIIDTTKPQIVSVYSEDTELSGSSINENLESLTIKYEISDNIAIDTIEVYQGLSDTDPEIINMDDVLDDENNENNSYTSYTGEITIEDGTRNEEIYFVITDKAGNVINTSSANEDSETMYDMSAFEFLRDITVSTNPFVRWYANRVLFWSSIGALAAIILGIFLIIFLKKRKKDEEEKKPES